MTHSKHLLPMVQYGSFPYHPLIGMRNDFEGELEGMSEDDYDRLPPPDVTFQWDKRQYGDTDHYNHERALDWLLNAREVFYQNRCSHMLGGIPDEELELFDEEIFRPENAKGSKQRMIVFMLLYQQYQFHKWKTQVSHLGTSTTAEPTDNPPPPSIFLLVEGKAGSGKSFILKTLRNITRAIMKSNLAELTSAPTGVAGSLINASTHCCVASIPTGKAVTKPPSKIAATNYQQLLSLAKSHQSIFSRFMDEHSMMGRKQFAWMKHRMEEFRRPFPLVDNNGQEVLYESDHPLEKSLYDRPFGGIPFIMSCGDFAQLPAVMDKMLFDNASATPNTADSCGKIAFAEFINSPDNESAISSVVIMDEVVRQEDRGFKLFLDNVANGSLDLDDVGLIRSGCLQCLS
jgi:PIF1 helicase.